MDRQKRQGFSDMYSTYTLEELKEELVEAEQNREDMLQLNQMDDAEQWGEMILILREEIALREGRNMDNMATRGKTPVHKAPMSAPRNKGKKKKFSLWDEVKSCFKRSK